MHNFWHCYLDYGLKDLNVSSFKTGKVTDLRGMFYQCFNLKDLDISGFNMDNLENKIDMFHINENLP